MKRFGEPGQLPWREQLDRCPAFGCPRARVGGTFEQRGDGVLVTVNHRDGFGLAPDGELILIDEALTPDSSRFWPADTYAVGTSPPSFDKQYVRDYLETLDWNKKAPAPKLPADVIEKTSQKYREALERIAGIKLGA